MQILNNYNHNEGVFSGLGVRVVPTFSIFSVRLFPLLIYKSFGKEKKRKWKTRRIQFKKNNNLARGIKENKSCLL